MLKVLAVRRWRRKESLEVKERGRRRSRFSPPSGNGRRWVGVNLHDINYKGEIMGIPESQLERWSHQGAVTTSKETYGTIKGALEDTAAKYHHKDFEIYLQGSYGNDTNIYEESDVDIVVQLNSTFHSNKESLPSDQFELHERDFGPASYHIGEFRKDVIDILSEHFGFSYIEDGKRSVKVHSFVYIREADVVVCTQYRKYDYYLGKSCCSFVEGMRIYNQGEEVINYPKLHTESLTLKQKGTHSRYKPLVRILKNIKTKLVELQAIEEKTAPSYFLEGWLYNAPNELYVNSIGDRFFGVVDWLLKADEKGFIMPHGMYSLLGNASTQWDSLKYKTFSGALVGLWNNWGK